ncbi:Oxoglutarate/iron-dependent oxygenase [Niveomyces insectorum RCEF 264]|uniref:Oxoglutarate/iron-dependent oxygenase n=1 Tax=Niveomyces insectorum RCEF 264 TaxID=1081102 RepID=A0A167XTU6_9HYPO|nr:Oxoglutarate/iron-dependent oxygenase [Niveomyces insectorum RCEF 264]
MSAEVTAELVGEIAKLLKADKGTFSIGGSIPIATTVGGDEAASDAADQHTKSAPIVVRWDPVSGPAGESRNMVFPPAVAAGLGDEQLAALLRDCQPATFGRGGEDVFDEEYRKASKLDASSFSSNLCPYGLGIVDTVAELLMPSEYMAGGSRGVRAELYKLNVYSAPSGHFKPHVDTPRSEQQFGSLVLCLPTVHAGGALVVRHGGQTITHDWGAGTGLNKDDAGPPTLQWAAFYSDCEHEVLEVTSGHRVTLTYNLYSVPQRLQVEGKVESMDVARLPLYHAVRDAVDNQLFLDKGGLVGYYCRHAYPHSAKGLETAPLFPSILKGVDLSFYNVLQALGLKPWVRQVLQAGGGWYEIPSMDKDKHDSADSDPIAALTTASRVSHSSAGTRVTEVGGYDGYTLENIRESFGENLDILWLNKPLPTTGQEGYVHLTYGNEAGVNTMYTYIGIIFEVKEWRNKKRTA